MFHGETSKNVSWTTTLEIQDHSIIVTSKLRLSFLDEDILNLVDYEKFVKVLDRRVASLNENKIDDFISILQDKFNASVSLNSQQFD